MNGRTVLVLPAWYPTRDQPLAGVFVRDHARAAAAHGHRMVIVVDEGPDAGVGGLFALSEERDEELQVFRLAYRPSTGAVAYLAGVLAVARRLSRDGTPVEILHAHVHRMAWGAMLAATLLRRPFVVTEHSSEWPRGMMTPGALRRARIAFRRAAIVCPVDINLQQAIERYGLRARFRIVPNAVDTQVFYPPPQVAPAPLRRLINVAQHVEVKGIDILLRAIALLAAERPEVTLELIGEGPQTPELRRLAEDLRVGDRVDFVGRLPTGEIAKALRSADLFVLSSLSENLPVALLEGLCSGLPAAVTSVGGVPAAVGTDGELAQPGDVGELSRGITAALDRYPEFDRNDIARRAAERWSLQTVGGLWDEIYSSL